ncbi:Glycerophosphoryl diester phosphodiesterase [Ignavibacterium album JCM 16511]|uniref:Glycerophosphoryl diester phosphodiesterase n=1 Tax=Ignavibacterium album (strain DSM 19864 / JCM 16511 / NBRC 101810 / Mat9-16) TaxID=945713 RepID=I0ANJ6_IGNAJ|nr:glycerophosphodiester phosphodiesterase family protein [Ignavibacterium album]AFH50553.1 Glycerophosphoryl diester phosphodiesterase [Ignavibacterium album JCM 16511]
MKVKTPIIVAHRGASYKAPENTIPAFKIAFDEQADFIEGDFWLTVDNEIICIHDSNTRRVGNKNIRVTSSTLDELKKVDVGIRKGNQFAGTTIPTLQEVLDIIPEQKGLHLEIKDNREKFLFRLKEILKESNIPSEKIRIISFHRNIIRAAKKYIPDIKAYLIFGWYFSKGNYFKSLARKLITKKIDTVNCDGLVIYSGSYIEDGFIKAFQSKNLDVCTYNVEDENKAQKLFEFGVDSITTNSPLMIRKAIQKLIE